MEVGWYNSPIGWLKISGNQSSIYQIEYAINKGLTIGNSPEIEKLKVQLNEFFNGTRQTFEINLNFNGSDFQNRVWQVLQQIPYGSTACYGEIAQKIGNPQASRAVGSANRSNPLPIVVPCHRVIGISGELVGYAGGLDKKKWLLEYEKKSN